MTTKIECSVAYCHKPACKNVKTCRKHRAYYVNSDRLHNQRCREKGTCIHCPLPPRLATRGEFKGRKPELRCEAHALVNTNRINKWAAEHPEKSKKDWQLKKALQKKGFCPYCREHRKLEEGQTHCSLCRVREKHGWEVMRAAEKSPALVELLLS